LIFRHSPIAAHHFSSMGPCRTLAASLGLMAAAMVVSVAEARESSLGEKASPIMLSKKNQEGKQDAIQLISIEDGKLQLREEAETWFDRIKQKQVYLIVLFGGVQQGKSTLATMLSCTFGQQNAAHFKTFREGDHQRKGTEGFWISKPFEFEQREYIVADIQGHDKLLGGEKENIIKILAMLSEVSAIFLQVVRSPFSLTQLNDIGHIFQDTRQHMISASESGLESQMHATDHPALMILVRYANDDLVQKSDDEVDEATKTMWAQLQVEKSEMATLIKNNFKNEHVSGTDVPFREHRIPTGKNLDNIGERFCDVLTDAENTLLKSQVETLKAKIQEQAARRELLVESKPKTLTGQVLWDFLLYGVNEMNLLGPLPQDEMWRHIMNAGCEVSGIKLAEKMLGETDKGALTKIKDYRKKHQESPNVAQEIDQIWDMNKREFETQRDQHLRKYEPVREMCNANITLHVNDFESQKDSIKKSAQLYISEVKRLEAERNADKFRKEADWERNKVFYSVVAIGLAVGGIALLCLANKVCSCFKSIAPARTPVYQQEMQNIRVEVAPPQYSEPQPPNWHPKH